MSKLPAIQFYPGDWLKDDIAGCSLAAQGLWLRIMFVMHESDRYGYLSKDGVAIPTESIARRCGCSPKEFNVLLDELERNGVPSRTSDGILFCRRMVHDEEERIKNRIDKRNSRARLVKTGSNVRSESGECQDDVRSESGRSSSSSSISSSEDINNNAREGPKGEPFDIPISESTQTHESLSEFLGNEETVSLARKFYELDTRMDSRATMRWLPDKLKQVSKEFVLDVFKTFLSSGGGPPLQFRSYLDASIGKERAKSIGGQNGKDKQRPRNYGYDQNSESPSIGTVVNLDVFEKR